MSLGHLLRTNIWKKKKILVTQLILIAFFLYTRYLQMFHELSCLMTFST